MKVSEGGFGTKKAEDDDSLMSADALLVFAQEKFAGQIAHIFTVIELKDEAGTVTLSDLPVAEQLMWLDIIKLNFLASPMED